jgi:ArsR family transcriptional regulator
MATVKSSSADADSALLAAIADPLRLRILRQLTDVGMCCACDIADNCPVSQPTVSHHLRVLREAGWITSERRGTWIWYSVRPEAIERYRRIGDSLAPSGAPTPRLPRLRVLQPGA